MSTSKYELHFVGPDDSTPPTEMRATLERFAADLEASDKVVITVVDDESESASTTSSPGSCDAQLTHLKVMFKVCTGKLADPVGILTEEEFAREIR